MGCREPVELSKQVFLLSRRLVACGVLVLASSWSGSTRANPAESPSGQQVIDASTACAESAAGSLKGQVQLQIYEGTTWRSRNPRDGLRPGEVARVVAKFNTKNDTWVRVFEPARLPALLPRLMSEGMFQATDTLQAFGGLRLRGDDAPYSLVFIVGPAGKEVAVIPWKGGDEFACVVPSNDAAMYVEAENKNTKVDGAAWVLGPLEIPRHGP